MSERILITIFSQKLREREKESNSGLFFAKERRDREKGVKKMRDRDGKIGRLTL